MFVKCRHRNDQDLNRVRIEGIIAGVRRTIWGAWKDLSGKTRKKPISGGFGFLRTSLEKAEKPNESDVPKKEMGECGKKGRDWGDPNFQLSFLLLGGRG